MELGFPIVKSPFSFLGVYIMSSCPHRLAISTALRQTGNQKKWKQLAHITTYNFHNLEEKVIGTIGSSNLSLGYIIYNVM